MDIKLIHTPGGDIAVIHSEDILIADVPSTLDLIATIGYEHGANRIAMNKSAVSEDFFKLSTGFAGEVVQKFVTYDCKLAIIGDFSLYTSKPLHDYMYECNNGNHLYFVSDEDEAVGKLSNPL
jgi:hypothetical protein